MSEETTTITRDRAITLINDSIENFATYFDSYCCDNRDSLSDEDRQLYHEMSEVTGILRNDADYANDLKIMPLEHLKQFLYMCKEMVENNDLFTKNSYPKGNIVIVENQEKKSYEKGWIIVLKDDKPVKIINNSGMDIIFVNSQGTITNTVKYESGSYTEFFGKNIGLSKAEANSLFIKANYTWTSGKMVGGYKAFDLQGKEIEPTIDGNAIEAKKEIIETNGLLPTITISNKKNSSQNSNEIETSELDRFIEIVRNTVGATYDHTRSPTKSKMDCSGVFVYAMQQLGYKIDKHLTAARMASGQISGIILYKSVDNGRQGNKGVLNFYKWGTSTVQHVNYGVGKNENENESQIIDASEGDTWQTNRNKNEKQLVKAKKNTVNQTWAPFSTKTKPDIQAYLDFSKFNKEIEIK